MTAIAGDVSVGGVRRVFAPALSSAWGHRLPAAPPELDKESQLWPAPPSLLVVSSTNWWESLSKDEQRECTVAQGLATIQLGLEFEASLIQRLVRSSLRAQTHDARILLHEAMEECRHSIWFNTVLELRPDMTPRVSRRFTIANSLIPRSALTTTSWISVLFGELLIDEFDRAAIADPSCGGPFKELATAHSKEEALHVRTAVEALRGSHLGKVTRGVSRLSIYLQLREMVTPAIPHAVAMRHGFPPPVHLGDAPTVYELVGRAIRRTARSVDQSEWGEDVHRRCSSMRLGGPRHSTVV